MGILDDIKANAVTELHLSNDPDDYFTTSKDFADAMAENTSIKEVIFDGEFLACSKGDDRATIVSSVGGLPNVEKVVLKDSLLMIGVCVANLTKNAKKLSDLTLSSCTLQGTPSDFDMFVNALKENDVIKSVHISESHAPHDGVDLGKVMNELREGLSIDISGAGA